MSTFRNVQRTAKLVLVAVVLGSSAVTLQAQEPFVEVNAEPTHRMKMNTAKYRVYDVLVGPADTMKFHEHKADNFAVLLSQSDITVETYQGQKTDASVKPGVVAFASASPTKPYVHRVLLRGGEPFRNITIELLQPGATSSAADAPEQVDPALSSVRDTPRGKAYRLSLEPNQSVTLPARVSDIFVVCLSEGSVQQVAGQGSSSWTCKAGDFRLMEQPRDAALKNLAAARVDLVVFALQ